jgi:aminopeptidase-like protein
MASKVSHIEPKADIPTQRADCISRMRSLIERHWDKNRVPVSDDTTSLIEDLAKLGGGEVLKVRSGEECLTWLIPPKWEVREAWCKAPNGDLVADFHRNPLYLRSLSAPFRGHVSREELLKHVRFDPNRPDRLVYDYQSQYDIAGRNEWGFSIPYRIASELPEGDYEVLIDSEFSDGELAIFDWTLPGEYPDTIFVAAHSCHPALVNDGIACGAVAMELFQYLLHLPSRRWTWRLIVGPEYYAAAAILAKGKNIEKLRYGLYLDMLGNGQPFGFSRSWSGNSYIDMVTRTVLSTVAPDAIESGYRGLWGNDEMFYDGPDFEIPTVGLGRAKWPHYHTDFDDLEHCSFDQLEEAVLLLERIAEVIENDAIPKRNYRGPLYQNRYGVHVDIRSDRAGYFALQALQRIMDGSKSCLECAAELGVSYETTRAYVDRLAEIGLVSLTPRNPR